ncbi:MAG: hypothetical protein FJX72_18350 [Armatimonadetes bacterium]|nr:hypothetical protein [Armatimonadota bacterium]
MGVKHMMVALLVSAGAAFGWWKTSTNTFFSSPDWTACRDAAIVSAAGSSDLLDIGVYQIPIEVLALSVDGTPYVGPPVPPRILPYATPTLEKLHTFVKHLNTCFWHENGIPFFFFESGLRGAGNACRFIDISSASFNHYYTSGWTKFATIFGDPRCYTFLLANNLETLSYAPSGGGQSHHMAGVATVTEVADSTTIRTVISHEAAHGMGLKHTFATSVTDFEKPDGSNALTVTDGLPETPSTVVGVYYDWHGINYGVPTSPSFRSGNDCTYYPDAGTWPSGTLMYNWLAANPGYTKNDFVMDWNNLMGYNGHTGWEIVEQQAWLMKHVLDWLETNSSLQMTPKSIQIYDPVTPTVTGDPPTNVNWGRIVYDQQGFIGFPDEYEVFSRASPSGTWMLRETVDATGLAEDYDYVPLVEDDYWRIQAVDTQSGFTWEWSTNNWAEYTFWEADAAYQSMGNKRADCR